MRKNCIETSPTTNGNLVCSLYKILDCFLVAYKEDELNKVKEAIWQLYHLCANAFFVGIFMIEFQFCCSKLTLK